MWSVTFYEFNSDGEFSVSFNGREGTHFLETPLTVLFEAEQEVLDFLKDKVSISRESQFKSLYGKALSFFEPCGINNISLPSYDWGGEIIQNVGATIVRLFVRNACICFEIREYLDDSLSFQEFVAGFCMLEIENRMDAILVPYGEFPKVTVNDKRILSLERKKR